MRMDTTGSPPPWKAAETRLRVHPLIPTLEVHRKRGCPTQDRPRRPRPNAPSRRPPPPAIPRIAAVNVRNLTLRCCLRLLPLFSSSTAHPLLPSRLISKGSVLLNVDVGQPQLPPKLASAMFTCFFASSTSIREVETKAKFSP